jgi:hypothetical protein
MMELYLHSPICHHDKGLNYIIRYRGWHISVCIGKGYGLDDRGLIPGRSKRFFSSSQRPDQPTSYPTDTGVSFSGCKAAWA